MAGETDNLATGGTDNADLTSIDNPENWQFFDPETDTEEQPEGKGTEGETVEDVEEQPETDSDETQETKEAEDETEAETDEEAEEQPEGESEDQSDTIKDDVLVTLTDGDQVELSELKQGYLRQSDFTRKTQELSNKRGELDAQTERIERLVEVFTDHLSKQIPDAPDPMMAYSDPQKYTAQKAVHDAAVARLQEIVALAETPKEVKQELSQSDHRTTLTEENQRLSLAMPMTNSRKGREDFFKDAMKGALANGYSEKEAKTAVDHRLLMLAYWANKGMAADKAKAKAKAKVADVPPVTPNKRPKGTTGKVQKNQDAMKRLSQTGSIYDAMKVDFD